MLLIYILYATDIIVCYCQCTCMHMYMWLYSLPTGNSISTSKTTACSRRENTCMSTYLHMHAHNYTHAFYYASLLAQYCDGVMLCHRFIALSSLVRGYANVPDAKRTEVGKMAL